MSIRSFWLIFLKVIGLFILFSCVTAVPTIIGASFMLGMNNEAANIILPACFVIVSLSLCGGLIYLFIFRTAFLINLFKLEADFEEEDDLEINIQIVTLLTLSTVVVGGLMVVHGIPALLKASIEYFSTSSLYTGLFDEGSRPGWMFFYLAQVIIGCFLIFKSRDVAAFIERFKNDEPAAQTGEGTLDEEEMN